MSRMAENFVYKRPSEPPPAVLDPHAQGRLDKYLSWAVSPDGYEEVVGGANSLVNDMVKETERLSKEHSPSRKRAVTRRYQQSESLMNAAHAVLLLDRDIQYGPILQDGTRKIKTRDHGLLKAVTEVFHNSAKEIDDSIASTVMTEVAASVYAELRKKRDERRQKENLERPKAIPETEIINVKPQIKGTIPETIIFEGPVLASVH